MGFQRCDGGFCQQRTPILGVFAPYAEDVLLEIDILDPQGNTLLQTKSAAIYDLCHEKVRSGKLLPQAFYLPAGQDDRKSPFARGPDGVADIAGFAFDHVPVEKKQCPQQNEC